MVEKIESDEGRTGETAKQTSDISRDSGAFISYLTPSMKGMSSWKNTDIRLETEAQNQERDIS